MYSGMWLVIDNMPHGFHIYPEKDCIEHDVCSNDCVCNPDVEYVDANGFIHPRGPLVIHNCVEDGDTIPHNVAVDTLNEAVE